MTDQDKINAILTAIQSDANLMILLRVMLTASISVSLTSQLDEMMLALGLNQ